MKRIPMDQLEHRRLYIIRSRNLVAGVWDEARRGFIGVREKFGTEYLFTEFHYDLDPQIGTVSGMEPTEHVLPGDVEMVEGRTLCNTCEAPAGWTQNPEITDRTSGTWGHVDSELDDQHKARAAYFMNQPLYEWLKPHSDAELEAWT